ncbi:MAG: hypothetical protein PWQ77_168 [Kosmotogales bacterium]|nr:hypothetical protein [Kosmotogales bacterium]
MPKKTFFNLKEDKRIRIIDAALNQFCSHPFDKVSINIIVKEANISKGSFYQYFNDKLDLYTYILEKIIKIKEEIFDEIFYNTYKDMNLFQILKLLIDMSDALFSKYQRYVKMSEFLFQDRSLRNEILLKYKYKTNDIITKLLEKERKKGSIKSGLPNPVLAQIIFQDIIVIDEYCRENENSNKTEVLYAYVNHLRDGLRGRDMSD